MPPSGRHGLYLPIIGDPNSFLKALKQSRMAAVDFGIDVEKVNVNAAKSVQVQIKAELQRELRLREEIKLFSEAAAAAKRGSQQQIMATNLAAQAQQRLSGNLGITTRESRRLATAHGASGRELSKGIRGALAGSGAFHALGRSLAFASGGFLLFASAITLMRTSISAAAEYARALSQIVGLVGISEAKVAALGQQMLRLAPQVAKGPVELAKAAYFITSAGITNTGEALSVLKASAQAATAGLGETKVVADALTSAVNAYGASNLSAARAGDVLVATVREGKAEAEALAPVLGNILPLAAQLGVRFWEVGAAMAAQTRIGVDVRVAAVNIQALFSGILKNSRQTAKGLAAVGLSAAGLRQELSERGLQATLQTMRVAFADNASAMAKAFPNVRALRGFLALMGKSASATIGIFQRMSRSTGDLAKAFAVAMKDPATRFEAFHAAMQSIEVMIGSALLPSMLDLANGMTAWLSKAKNQRQLNEIFVAAGKAIRDGASALRGLFTAADDVAGLLGGWKTTIELATGAFVGFKLAGVGAAVAVMAANLVAAKATASAWRAALISTGWGALAVAAGLAATYVLAHWDKVKRWFRAFWISLKAEGTIVWDWLKWQAWDAARLMIEPFSHLPGAMGAWARDAKESLKQGLAAIEADMGAAQQRIVAAWGMTGASSGAQFVAAYNRAIAQLPGKPTQLPPGPGMYPPEVAVPRSGRGLGPITDVSKWLEREFGMGKRKAALTAGTNADDLRIARAEKAAIERAIAQGRLRNTAQLKAAYDELASVNQQLANAAEDASSKAKEAAEFSNVFTKRWGLALAKAAATAGTGDDLKLARQVRAWVQGLISRGGLSRENLTAAYEKLAEVNSQLADAAKDAAKKAADAREKMKQKLDEALGQIGALFAGPVLAPTEQQVKTRLGVPGPSMKNLTADVAQQARLATSWLADLQRLARRGAPKGLLTELRAAGPEQAQIVHELATAATPQLKQLYAAYAARAKAAREIATVKLNAQQVTLTANRVIWPSGATGAHARQLAGAGTDERPIQVTLELDGRTLTTVTTTRQQRSEQRTATQRRGRHPGYQAK